VEPSVTVLTAVRNGARYIADTVVSIRSQTFEDWEHIIVDDASDDETPGLLQRMAADDRRIKVLRRTASGGPYAAANEGLRGANGRYVVMIDGDDVARPDRIANQIDFLEDNPELQVCAGGWQEIDASGARVGDPRVPPSNTSRSLSWSLPVVSGVAHSTMCVRRSALTEIGGYPELSIAGDYAVWLELARRNWLGVAPHVVVDYRTHSSGVSRDLETLRSECLGILRRHMNVMTGAEWEPDEIEALWSTGRWQPAPLAAGFAALDRWERGWRADPSLSSDDRRVLRNLGARLRARHLKWNHGRDLRTAVSGLLQWARLQLEPNRARARAS
jgi:glycosyltransferase involved in cell wall biosynthesis